MVTLRFAVPAILATAAAAGCFSYFVITLKRIEIVPSKARPAAASCEMRLAHDMRDFFRAAAERPLIWINSLTLGGVQVVQAPENGTLQ